MIGLPKDLKDALVYLDIQPGMHVVQFGAQRRGHIADALSKEVGARGKVTVVDVVLDELRAIEMFFASRGVHWVDVAHGDFVKLKGTSIANESVDRVLVVHTAWRHPNHEEVLAEARRILKPGGKILFLDWQKQTKDPLGVQVNGHLDMLEAQRLCIRSGCERVERVLNNDKHWAFVMNFKE